MKTEYDQQAAEFLTRNGVKLRITLSNTKTAPWGCEESGPRNHYRVTLSRTKQRLAFDFWGSVNDARNGQDPSEYDILACISSDAYCPGSFEDFCSEYGYDSDSIQALQTFRRCDRFAKRLREFFSPEELEQLAEIR